MIKLKGDKLIITGKDEKLFKECAKKANMSPKEYLSNLIARMMKKFTFFEKDILLEKLK